MLRNLVKFYNTMIFKTIDQMMLDISGFETKIEYLIIAPFYGSPFICKHFISKKKIKSITHLHQANKLKPKFSWWMIYHIHVSFLFTFCIFNI